MNPLYYIWNHPLSRRRRRVALARFFRWQIGARILGRPVVMPFVGDVCFVAERGMTGITGNIYCGLHEFPEMALLLHCLRPEDGFFDVGANVGSWSLLAGGVVGCKTIAIEPAHCTFAKLFRNILINNLQMRISAHHTAAGREAGTVRFTTDRGTKNALAPPDYQGDAVDVPVVTVDSLASEGRPVRMLKVDTEGWDAEVLLGAARILQSEAQVLVVEADHKEVVEIIRDAGFTRFAYDPFTRAVVAAEGATRTIGSNNHLWCRDREWLTLRCRSAPMFSTLGIEL